MTIQLSLYSTTHCHLCEQAEVLMISVAKHFDINWNVIEITDYPELLALYEVKIPVLKRLDNHMEICWPFDKTDIAQLLQYSSNNI